MQTESWNSLEVVKLALSFLTPVSVAVFGYFISQRLKQFELLQWSNQKIIEKRLMIYDQMAPKLNRLLCFYTWVGIWKEISPEEVLKIKRDLDQTINIYCHLFDKDVFESYQSFIHTLFKTYQGAGVDAKIRSVTKGPDGDRTTHCCYTWDNEWDQKFSINEAPEKAEIRTKYYSVMASLRKSLGLGS